MKKFVIVLVLVMLMGLQSCAPKWLVFNSNGIASYNRHTGQFEILWENNSSQVVEKHDTVTIIREIPAEKKDSLR